MEDKERLAEIARNSARKLTKEDKEFVSLLCETLGVEINKSRCSSCYIDAAIECYNILCNSDMEDDESERDYVLKDGVDVFFDGMRVNKATLTDEMARWIILAGFPRDFFSKAK